MTMLPNGILELKKAMSEDRATARSMALLKKAGLLTETGGMKMADLDWGDIQVSFRKGGWFSSLALVNLGSGDLTVKASVKVCCWGSQLPDPTDSLGVLLGASFRPDLAQGFLSEKIDLLTGNSEKMVSLAILKEVTVQNQRRQIVAVKLDVKVSDTRSLEQALITIGLLKPEASKKEQGKEQTGAENKSSRAKPVADSSRPTAKFNRFARPANTVGKK